MKPSLFLVLMLMFCSALCSDVYVDYAKGKKNNPGTKEQPMDKVARALPKLRPGDTLYILPSASPIRDTIDIRALCGSREKPIVIDGMNNVFLGSVPLTSAKWQQVKPGLFCSERKYSANMASRYYMIRNGHAVCMGRCTKGGKNPPFKALDDLQPGEWTIETPEKDRIKIYLRLCEGEKSPAEGNWEEPSLLSGVHIAASCTDKACGHQKCGEDCPHVHCGNLIIRNVIVKHFWNDGFNIHGKVKNLTFEQIAAVECGDDGFSAHEAAEVLAKDYVSIRNSSGISHIQQADARHENVYIEGSRGVDFLPMNGANTLTNVWVKGESRRGVVFAGRTAGELKLQNCLFVNSHPKAQFYYSNDKSTRATFDRVRIAGYKRALTDDGIQQLTDTAAAEAELAQKRVEFFKLFDGALERACGEESQSNNQTQPGK